MPAFTAKNPSFHFEQLIVHTTTPRPCRSSIRAKESVMATVTSNERPVATTAAAPKALPVWAGRVLSALPVLMLVMSGAMKLMHKPEFVGMWTGKLGWPEGAMSTIGILELACVVVYVVPRSAFLGAILLTGYLGGAVSAHVRIGDAFAIPIVLGVMLWAGLFLRDPRIRSLVLTRKA
jgi:hypothetical protein